MTYTFTYKYRRRYPTDPGTNRIVISKSGLLYLVSPADHLTK